MSDVEGRIVVGPQDLRTSLLLEDGLQLSIRPIHPTDEPRMKELFYALSKESIYYRFMSYLKRIPLKQIQNFVYVDHRNEVAIVATLQEAYGEEIVAAGGYYLDPRTNRAEVAFVVRDEWHNNRIGTFLLQYLMTIAKRNGIAGFTAEVLKNNKPMLTVFDKCACEVKTRLEDDVYCLDMDF